MPHRKAAVLLVFFLLIALPLRAAQERYDIPTADSPGIGPENAPATIVEFIDFT